MFIPSAYQQAIFQWGIQGSGDAVVSAVPGSGKTTTLLEFAKVITGKAVFVAFNKHIAEHLAGKLKGTSATARTIHSIGYGCIAKAIRPKIKVEEYKYADIVADWVDEHITEWSQDYGAPKENEAVTMLTNMVEKVRLTLTDPKDMTAILTCADRFNVDVYIPAMRGIATILRRGEKLAEKGIIDYTDMLYLPYVWNLTPDQYPWTLADECQDFSAAQLDLVLKLASPGGRRLFVGDPNQSIMAFAGADSQSFYAIKERTGAIELSLSICYRCPDDHLNLARKIVSHIESSPSAAKGAIIYTKESNLVDMACEGDLIICRTTAPLITYCINFIAKRKPARVRGRDIASQLATMIKAVEQLKGFTYAEFPVYLEQYRLIQISRLSLRKATESAIQSLEDRVQGILACYDAYPECTTTKNLIDSVKSLFSDDRASITLSTVHKAKGLEANRVVVLYPEKLPLVWKDQTPEEFEQEMHIKLVALTRSMDTLIFAEGEQRQATSGAAQQRAA